MDNAENNRRDSVKERKIEITLLFGQDWLSYPLCQIQESAVYCLPTAYTTYFAYYRL